jgi:predicted Rossmann-fold nucleotide-binding protein
MGTDYWGGLLDWMRERMAGEGKIGPLDLDLLLLADDAEDAVRHIVEADKALAAEREALEDSAAMRLAVEPE